MRLYQKSRTGKIKFLDIKTSGKKLTTIWGIVGGKTQTSEKVCTPTNEGRANERDGKQQAEFEKEAKITLKKKEGYTEKAPGKTAQTRVINLDKIPPPFCPDKPISEAPRIILNGLDTMAQRKHNGHCVFLVKGKKTEKIYSRRMEDYTPQCKDLPFIKAQLQRIKPGDFVLTEIVFYHRGEGKEIPRYVAKVIRTEDPDEAMTEFKENSQFGDYSCIPFDTLFHKHKFVGNKDYRDRYAILEKLRLRNIATDYSQAWQGAQEGLLIDAKRRGWEGFVLRTPGEKSYIGFSMDGKAHRQGSWKYKFTHTDEFIVDEVLWGKSGKHAKFYSKFHVIQFDRDGEEIDRGYVGPGTLTHDQLKDLTLEINTRKIILPFVVEIEFQSFHDETGKLEFGQILRLREDKTPGDVTYED